MGERPIMAELSLGQWLKDRREALGLSLRDVARITEGRVSDAYLSQLENGHIDAPSARHLHMLAAAYALDFAEMLTRAGDPNTPPVPETCPTCGRMIYDRRR